MGQFTSEIVKSVKFFQTKYPDTPVSEMLLSGYGTVVPSLDLYVGQKAGIATRIASPWVKVRVPEAQQIELQRISAEFAVAVGLAQKGDI